MNTSYVPKRPFRCPPLLAAVLVCLVASSCFRGYDLSNVKCVTDKDCPQAYPSCVLLPGQPFGTCTSSLDGSRSDQLVSQEADGKPADGVPATDGLHDLGGVGGVRSDAFSGGEGGTTGGSVSGGSGGIDAPFGGEGGAIAGGKSGGVETADGAVSTGGAAQGSDARGGATANLDAPLGAPDAASKGAACTLNSQCANNLCIDGFCCDRECIGCNACAGALTGADDGTCAPVSAGNDPHETCADETISIPAKPCGNDGHCDGKGTCRKVGAGQECGAASCSTDGKFTPAPKCDGKGGCVTGTPQACAPYDCATTGCKKTCSVQNPCDTGSYCESGTCVNKKALGDACTPATADRCSTGFCVDDHCCSQSTCGTCQSCTGTGGACVAVTNADDADTCGGTNSCNSSGACKKRQGQPCGAGSECGSTFCADGVCCDRSCGGACESCNGTTPGTCGFVTGAAQHGTCSGTGVCQGRCEGNSASCAPASTSTVCHQPTCDSTTNIQSSPATCTPSGTCPDVLSVSCSPFKCGSTACLTNCSSSSLHCAAGAACISSACQMCGSGQSVCGNACISTSSDPSHCGDCSRVCGTGTPFCVNSTCVQCKTSANCPSGYLSCNAGTCGCRVPDAGNKIVNPGFDGSAAPWVLNGGVYLSTSDADNCPASGVMQIPSSASPYTTPFQQCVSSIGGGVPYKFGFRFQGAPNCSFSFYSMSGCASKIEGADGGYNPDTSIPLWSDAGPVTGTTPAATVSVSISCAVSMYYPGTTTTYDQIYFNTGSGAF